MKFKKQLIRLSNEKILKSRVKINVCPNSDYTTSIYLE